MSEFFELKSKQILGQKKSLEIWTLPAEGGPTWRHAAELVCVRKELEQQYADDLQRDRSAVVESFKALTGSILEKV